MNRKIFILISLFTAAVVIYFFSPSYRFKYYYYSMDSSIVLTRITYSKTIISFNKDYLVPGFFKDRQLPDTFVSPDNTLYDEWAEYVTFHSNGILIVGDSSETKNLTNNFQYLNGTVVNYNESIKIDSIKGQLKNPENIAIYNIEH